MELMFSPLSQALINVDCHRSTSLMVLLRQLLYREHVTCRGFKNSALQKDAQIHQSKRAVIMDPHILEDEVGCQAHSSDEDYYLQSGLRQQLLVTEAGSIFYFKGQDRRGWGPAFSV